MDYKVGNYTIHNEVRTISPQEASDIIATRNTKNRRANKNHIKALALNMANGTWRYNGDPLRFDANGTLIDGQHRLMAQVMSGKTILYNVIAGLDPECIKAIDIEAKTRNLSDLFYMDGIKNAFALAGAINRYFSLSFDLVSFSAPKNNGAGQSTSAVRSKASAEERYDFYYNNQSFVDLATENALQFYRKMRIMQVSDLGGLFMYLYIDKHHSYDEIEKFINQLFTSSEINCINELRRKFIQDLTASKKMSGSFRQNLFAKTWNYYIKGKDVKVLSYNPALEGTIEFL